MAMAWRPATHRDAQATRRWPQWIDPGAAMLFGPVAATERAGIVALALAKCRMLRLTLAHGVLSFAFKLVVPGLGVNLFAGGLA